MLGRQIHSLVPAHGALDELRRALLEQWAAIRYKNIVELLNSMPRRINAVLQLKEVLPGIDSRFLQKCVSLLKIKISR